MIGVEVYVTPSVGIDGAIRQLVEDFVVEETLVDGSRAEKASSKTRAVLGSSSIKSHYLLCVLTKRDWDMFKALKTVAEQLGTNVRRIQIAGIKDARALTSQYITIEGVSAEDVQKVNAKDINIHPVGYLRYKLSSYYLLGNNFKIAIRATKNSESTIRKRIKETIEQLETVGGVPNFFGHQRFGTVRPITHLVGKAMVEGSFQKAAMQFLAKPSRFEHPESRQARMQLQATQDFEKGLKNFPKKLRYERLMLKHLVSKPDDFIGAFRRLPIKLQKLFPQAYQAYIFNKFLSRRIASGFRLNRAEIGDYAVSVERSGLPLSTMYKIANSETLTEINKAIAAGKMRVAIPLVGFRQRLSFGIQGEIEKRILEKEGTMLGNFKVNGMLEVSCRGELRTVMTPLNNFSLVEISSDSVNPSKYKTKVHFMLHRGSYATILLRELVKPRNLIKAGF